MEDKPKAAEDEPNAATKWTKLRKIMFDAYALKENPVTSIGAAVTLIVLRESVLLPAALSHGTSRGHPGKQETLLLLGSAGT